MEDRLAELLATAIVLILGSLKTGQVLERRKNGRSQMTWERLVDHLDQQRKRQENYERQNNEAHATIVRTLGHLTTTISELKGWLEGRSAARGEGT